MQEWTCKIQEQSYTYNHHLRANRSETRRAFDKESIRQHRWSIAFGCQKSTQTWRGGSKKLENYTSTKEGLLRWCHDMDTKFADKEIHAFTKSDKNKNKVILDESTSAIFMEYQKSLPCHAEWFRYIQWHNRAYQVSKQLYNFPVHYLYYDQYTTNYNETVNALFAFLQLDIQKHEPHPFHSSGKTYSSFYVPEHARLATKMVQRIAMPEVWKLLQHYFEPWVMDFE